MRCLAFANANNGSNAGAVHVNSNNGFSNANSNYGARLTTLNAAARRAVAIP